MYTEMVSFIVSRSHICTSIFKFCEGPLDKHIRGSRCGTANSVLDLQATELGFATWRVRYIFYQALTECHHDCIE